MDLFIRHEKNPILTVNDLPFPAIGVYNPGVSEFNGEVVLLLRVEMPDGRSSLHLARSRDGISNWTIEPYPFLSAENPIEEYESIGCEDPRITFVSELSEWFITYVAVSEAGAGVALARTKDFSYVERLGLILPPPNKDAVLFPRRINGKWYMLHRPMSWGKEHIWLATSLDLIHWGHPKIVLEERGGTWWDSVRVGAGTVPIETPYGWLIIYHGVKLVAGIPNYRLGLTLLDLENPVETIARSQFPVLSPKTDYERIGNGLNIVFTCGALVRDDNVWLYYGAADTCVALATAKLSDLLSVLQEETD